MLVKNHHSRYLVIICLSFLIHPILAGQPRHKSAAAYARQTQLDAPRRWPLNKSRHPRPHNHFLWYRVVLYSVSLFQFSHILSHASHPTATYDDTPAICRHSLSAEEEENIYHHSEYHLLLFPYLPLGHRTTDKKRTKSPQYFCPLYNLTPWQQQRPSIAPFLHPASCILHPASLIR